MVADCLRSAPLCLRRDVATSKLHADEISSMHEGKYGYGNIGFTHRHGRWMRHFAEISRISMPLRLAWRLASNISRSASLLYYYCHR